MKHVYAVLIVALMVAAGFFTVLFKPDVDSDGPQLDIAKRQIPEINQTNFASKDEELKVLRNHATQLRVEILERNKEINSLRKSMQKAIESANTCKPGEDNKKRR